MWHSCFVKKISEMNYLIVSDSAIIGVPHSFIYFSRMKEHINLQKAPKSLFNTTIVKCFN